MSLQRSPAAPVATLPGFEPVEPAEDAPSVLAVLGLVLGRFVLLRLRGFVHVFPCGRAMLRVKSAGAALCENSHSRAAAPGGHWFRRKAAPD